MTHSQFFKHFDLLADLPDAVVKMRELVLQLAVQGRLLPSDGKDKSARDLAARIRAAKKSGFAPISDEGTPFSLPPTWEWVRVGEAMNLVNGRAFKPTDWSNEGLPIVRIQNLNNPDAPHNYCNFEVDEKVLLRNGDFLISWSGTPGTSFGAFIWNRGKAVLNQHIFRAELLGEAYTKEFLRLAVNGRLEEMIAKAHGAVGLQHITKGKLELLVLPLPPMAEQRRIVAKVDELMALCDELAARQQARHAARAQLTQSAYHHLTNAKDPADFRCRFNFILQHSSFILEDVPRLRQAILQLAVQGRLVPQNPKDDHAKNPIGAKQIEAPIDTASHWRWFQFEDVMSFGPVNGLSLRPASRETNTRALTLTATTSGKFRDDCFKYIDQEIPVDSELWLRSGDILIQRGNSIDYVGVAAIYTGKAHQFIYPDLMIKVRVDDYAYPAFAHLVLNSPFGRAFFRSHATGTSGNMPKINHGVVKSFPFPLPPLAEQKRIVARVEALLRQCDALEAQLRQTRTLGAHLLDSTLHHLLAA